MPKYLTKEKLEELKKELNYLKTVKRKEIAKTLNHTASFGDLSENFAYQQAKDEQGLLEIKIKELEEIINQAKIIKKRNTGKVEIGSVVFLKNNSQKESFQIVDPKEANPFENKISFQSPLGQELMGKKIGDKIKINTQEGIINYQIVKIS